MRVVQSISTHGFKGLLSKIKLKEKEKLQEIIEIINEMKERIKDPTCVNMEASKPK